MSEKILADMYNDPFSSFPMQKDEIERVYGMIRLHEFILKELDRILADESRTEYASVWDARALIKQVLED
jgi:hypothetical protein